MSNTRNAIREFRKENFKVTAPRYFPWQYVKGLIAGDWKVRLFSGRDVFYGQEYVGTLLKPGPFRDAYFCPDDSVASRREAEHIARRNNLEIKQ